MYLNESKWTCYEEFKLEFLTYFWSSERQLTYRNAVFRNYHQTDRSLSMSEYFVKQVNIFKTFTPPLGDDLILMEIMKQFPINLQSLWGVYPDRSLSGALTFLERQGPLMNRSRAERPIASTLLPHSPNPSEGHSSKRNYRRHLPRRYERNQPYRSFEPASKTSSTSRRGAEIPPPWAPSSSGNAQGRN